MYKLWLFWAFATCTLSYLLGSIPFGVIIARVAGLGDLRSIGSGNIGATNVMRTGRKGLAALTLLLDGGKGFAAVMLTKYLYPEDMILLAGLLVVLGHIFPVWLSFKGGKGVATVFGVFFALNWMFALLVCLVWLIVFFLSGFSSLSSIMSIGYSWIIAYVVDTDVTALLCLCMAPIILLTHRGNIKRLLQGTEQALRKGLL